MDSSIRSSKSRINAVKGASSVKGLEPGDLATLLFDEVHDLSEMRLLRWFVEGPDTGVVVNYGRSTVSWSSVPLPTDYDAVGIATSHALETHWPVDDSRHEGYQRWGTLLLARDNMGQSHWLWANVWTPFALPTYGKNTVVELDVNGLAALMAPGEKSSPDLDGATVYALFAALMQRRAKYYHTITNGLILQYQRTKERSDRVTRGAQQARV